jgi:preprotein translocase subunit SecE
VPVRSARQHHHATEEGEVADRKRRGEDDAQDRLDDEVFDDDAFDDAVDDDANEDEDEDDEPVSRGGTATRARKKAEAGGRPVKEKKDAVKVKKDTERGGGPFGWISRFVREVIAEMRKVIWPTRKELLTYTAVVVVFVTAITAIVAGLDYGFGRVVLWVFGK